MSEPTNEAWARTLIGGIGVYAEYPADHPEQWPHIVEILKSEGYRIVQRDDALYAEPITD